MDYKFRFYSPALNRFIQPDSIVPDPTNPQAWNRFSYVYNNPIIYTDPTGHEICDTEGYCGFDTINNRLQNGGNPNNGKNNNDEEGVPLLEYPKDCDKVQYNGYCHTGDQMEQLYILYRETDGWWNNYGENQFTPVDFLALMLYYEFQDLTKDPNFVEVVWQIVGKKMQWLCEYIGSSCDGVIPTNAIFNYVATRESAGTRYTSYFILGDNLHTYNEYETSIGPARYVANMAVFNANLADPRIGNSPDFGNASMFSDNAQGELNGAVIGWCRTCVLYSAPGSDPAYFMTENQLNYWNGR